MTAFRGQRAFRQACRLIAAAALASALASLQPDHAEQPSCSSPCQTSTHSPSEHPTTNNDLTYRETPYHLTVRSNIAAVADGSTLQLLYLKNANKVTPIASITKLMTAIVILDAKLPLQDVVAVSDEDVDQLRGTRSRLSVGSRLTREDMLHLALMGSENRAAACLSRCYPGGRPAFIEAMNRKALELGMEHTHFVSPNGLSAENVSTALDLVRLVKAADEYPLIRQFSTDAKYEVFVGETGKRCLQYVNTNRLVRHPGWEIELQKTGYINESGRCMVMEALVDGRKLIMVFLDSYGTLTRFADATRVRKQLAAQKEH
jgi:D-alanyl-D-alanine endopeptidase (penicillin-binding protein 7)